MFEFMDGVVDALEELGQAAVDGAVYYLICGAKLALIITAPSMGAAICDMEKGA